MQAGQNFTIPPGWTDHGVEGLICKPADFVAIASFFLSNYIAHLFSLKWYPAEPPRERIFAMFTALFYPAFGLLRAVEHIRRSFGKGDELQRAQDAEALCMVLRSKTWVPEEGQEIGFVKIQAQKDNQQSHKTQRQHKGYVNLANDDVELGSLQTTAGHQSQDQHDESGRGEHLFRVFRPPWYNLKGTSTNRPLRTIKKRGCKVHGRYILPEGYELAYVPRTAVLKQQTDLQGLKNGSLITHISASDGWVNALISIYQVGASIVTLYRSRGDQISRYGYSAFGLTVIPYVLMTIINLVSRVLGSDYPMLYMIRSPEMDEAIQRGGYFEGSVGQLEPLQKDSSEGGKLHDDETLQTLRITGVDLTGSDKSRGYSFLNTDTGVSVVARLHELPDKNKRHTNICIPCCSPFATNAKHEKHAKQYPWKPDLHIGSPFSKGTLVLPLGLLAIVVILYGALSRFKSGSETTNITKGFIMSWIVLGSFGVWAGLLFRAWDDLISWWWEGTQAEWGEGTQTKSKGNDMFLVAFVAFTVTLLIFVGIAGVILLTLFVPAIGGMVMVGLMIKDFGQCTRI